MAAGDLSFLGRVKQGGLRGLNQVLDRITDGIRNVLGKKKLEKLVLATMKGRFAKPGTTPVAQKDPDNRPWVPITDYTARHRFRNRNRTQALVDTGALLGAITVTRDRLSDALSAPVGIARIGIPPTSPQYDKGLKMNEGYTKRARGGGLIRIPARPFIGIGKPSTTAVSRFIDRVFARIL